MSMNLMHSINKRRNDSINFYFQFIIVASYRTHSEKNAKICMSMLQISSFCATSQSYSSARLHQGQTFSCLCPYLVAQLPNLDRKHTTLYPVVLVWKNKMHGYSFSSFLNKIIYMCIQVYTLEHQTCLMMWLLINANPSRSSMQVRKYETTTSNWIAQLLCQFAALPTASAKSDH